MKICAFYAPSLYNRDKSVHRMFRRSTSISLFDGRAAPEHIRYLGLFFGYILKKLILKMVQRIVLRMLVKLSVMIVLNGRRPEKLGVRCVNRYDFRKISI
ncbi:hypothetical protein OS493_010929 [Desmophyllum pertusum]|uniref:Uncharacterized protein n=1 Tax=Desmophyllum pertusum TaxID=174260 RepID=A0A9W9ZF68_9CNID|nr:hypothetical protein OS493_010929 [Desmophyllum pertusum]